MHNYVYCWNFQNSRGCSELLCKYLHVSIKDMQVYNYAGRKSRRLLEEVSRTHQDNNKACRDFLNSAACSRGDTCPYQHVKVGSTDTICCGVCFERIRDGEMSRLAGSGHVFCHACLRSIIPDCWGRTTCPCCRAMGNEHVVS